MKRHPDMLQMENINICVCNKCDSIGTLKGYLKFQPYCVYCYDIVKRAQTVKNQHYKQRMNK